MGPPSPAAVHSAARSEDPALPTPEIIGYSRRLLLRRYHMRPQDADDVIGQALLDFVAATRRRCLNADGLFLVIAQRRGHDWRRRHRSDLPLCFASRVAYPPDLDEVEAGMIFRQALHAAGRWDKRRLLGIAGRILAGASFAEACRANGVPRGSQQRYRRALRECFAATLPSVRRSDSGPFRSEG